MSNVRVVFHPEELIVIARSESMKRNLGRQAMQVKMSARAAAPLRTGKLRRGIGYYVATDAFSAYADIYTDAQNKGFRYGAYWNAVTHYLDNAVR